MNSKHDEGYIKFHYDWIKTPLPDYFLGNLFAWRQRLYEARLIGSYPDGIGYGNISIRYNKTQFIISGTASGNISDVDSNHFTLVKDFDLDQNFLLCHGPIAASSESLSHAAIYMANPSINAIIHTHDRHLWNKYLDKLPTTHPNAEFGTTALALNLSSIVKSERQTEGIIIMSGHQDGIIFYGSFLNKVGTLALNKR